MELEVLRLESRKRLDDLSILLLITIKLRSDYIPETIREHTI